VEADQQALVTEAEQRDGTYRIDIEKSTLEWIGRNLNKRHYGSIAVQAGELVIASEKLSAGTIVLDMTTVSCLDLQDPDWRDMLIRHLISDDFYAAERYPTALFTLNRWEVWEVQPGASPEAPPRGLLLVS
jgi:polyisoprenoid-binding protein YceI